MRFLKLITLCASLALVACASITAPSIQQQIYAADKGVTTVIQGTDVALTQHLITPAQAQSVSSIAHQVGPLLDSARAATQAQDVAGATKTMQLINSLLAGLQAYVITSPQL